MSHRAINRLVCNTDYIALQPADRVAQASNFCFDAATFEIWGALLHGARLVYIGRDTLLSPWSLGEQIHALGISVLFLRPLCSTCWPAKHPQRSVRCDISCSVARPPTPAW